MKIKRVGWNDIDSFLDETKKLPFEKTEKYARAAEMLACNELEGEKIYGVLTRAPKVIFHGLLWGIPAYYLFSNAKIPLDPIMIWLNVFLVASTGVSLGAHKDVKLIKKYIQKKRTAKYETLLKGRWIEEGNEENGH